MNKKIIMKGIFLLIVIALLTVGFTGCGSSTIIITTTGTVYITVSVPGYYDIYIDGVYQNTTNSSGKLIITKVPMGNYFFEVDGHDYGYSYYGRWWWYEGTRSQTIYASTNNVTIPVTLYYYYY